MSEKSPRPSKLKRSKPKIERQPMSSSWILASGLVALLVIGSFAFFGKHGILDRVQQRSLLQKLNQENEVLFQQQQELKSELSRLQDPRYLEFIARERLGLMKEGETFIVLDGNKTAPGSDSEEPKNSI